MIIIVDTERESLALETVYQLSASLGIIDLKCDVEVIEFIIYLKYNFRNMKL